MLRLVEDDTAALRSKGAGRGQGKSVHRVRSSAAIGNVKCWIEKREGPRENDSRPVETGLLMNT